ncbi:rRNA maturation RNase YbeY [Altericista sp. CCNU0014]|uniref:rRNA maturation RNase YbeY n=1 Tax=Altericista sp. CCNU0014 TaxID=3082949 RepID=UPI00384F99AC
MVQVDLTLQVQPHTASATDEAGETAMAGLSEAQWQTYFEQWIDALNPQQSKIGAYEVSLLLTTDAEIQALNATYRHQDRATDVLAFASLEWEGPHNSALDDLPTPLGDIAISVETAARQAAENGHDLSQELLWLASHGLLHLLGWDHPDPSSLDLMLTEQARLIRKIGFLPPSWSAEELGYF